MTFSAYFKISSYAMVGAGALALAVSGGMGIMLAAAFASVMLIAWGLEGTRWQLPERVGLGIVLLSLPLFYLDWRYQTATGDARERVGVSALAHLILFLSAVKLLQIKADRDWVFLYLISFFEVLLAAGLTLSPLFLATLGLYTLCALSTIISFEIRKARRRVRITETRLLVAPDSTLIRRLIKRRGRHQNIEARRLPIVAFVLLVLIFALAMPLFLIAPRYGSSALARTGGLSGFVGFSDTVNLGDIGRLQQSERVVMRVRVEEPEAERNRSLRWRGVALDEFSGRGWRRSRGRGSYEPTGNERNLFQLGTIDSLHRITTQTFFMEPIDTPVLFAAPRAVALQGPFPYVRRDTEGALSTRPHDLERITYKAYSDTTEPEPEALRADLEPYPQEYPRGSRLSFTRYLQLPDSLDPRIAGLAHEWLVRAGGVHNRYDAARVIEERLQSDFGYTLDLKAGGPDPLADFLFRVREGHCEYFSTAMAVMLRTQGVAARVVNGFQTGEYNDAADAYTVSQRDAHSWVEVYFPETDAWVTFDPTPPGGRPAQQHTGLTASLGKYAEALELMWIQYVVGYDKQEQRSLATGLRNRLSNYRHAFSDGVDALTASAGELWRTLTGQNSSENAWQNGASGALLLLPPVLLIVLLGLLVSRAKRLGLWRGLWFWRRQREGRSVVEFYERMTAALAARGLERASDETPLEFATSTGMTEALRITRAYNRVRYGEQHLSASEAAEIEEWLSRLEGEQE